MVMATGPEGGAYAAVDDVTTKSSALAERLDQLEQRADRMHVPVAFAHVLYTLKVHTGPVRRRVRAAGRGLGRAERDPGRAPGATLRGSRLLA